jgi:hypothetical protein
MHLSIAFDAQSALFAAVGGACIGAVCAARVYARRGVMPSATPHRFTTIGVVAGGFASALWLADAALFDAPSGGGVARIVAGTAAGLLVGGGATLGQGCTR